MNLESPGMIRMGDAMMRTQTPIICVHTPLFHIVSLSIAAIINSALGQVGDRLSCVGFTPVQCLIVLKCSIGHTTVSATGLQ